MKPSEHIACSFHEAYERLAPSFGYKTKLASRMPWHEMEMNLRRLMTATVEELLAKGIIHPNNVDR